MKISPACCFFADGQHILHTTGELRQRLLRICSAMEAENAVRRQGR